MKNSPNWLFLSCQKFGEIDGHVTNPEEEFDKLKEVMEANSKAEEGPANEETLLVVKKKSSTPKVRAELIYGFVRGRTGSGIFMTTLLFSVGKTSRSTIFIRRDSNSLLGR